MRQLVQSDSQVAADQTESLDTELYPGHIRTTPLQKALLGVGSTLMALYNPARDGKGESASAVGCRLTEDLRCPVQTWWR